MLIMDTLGKKIRLARFEANIDQKELARLLNVPKEYISYWESDKRTPGIEQISALCRVLNRAPNYFFGIEESESSKRKDSSVSLRLAGEVSCGNLTYATSENGEYVTEDMPFSFFSKYGTIGIKEIEENYFVLKAKGDSMSPYIEEGDQLICKRVSDVDSGKIAVVINPDSEATVKIISKRKGELRLTPINPRHVEKIFTEADGELRVIAEVVYIIRRSRAFIM